MANTDPELLKAAQLAYERSNASLQDYNPDALPEDKKVGEVEREAPLEPILTTADNGVAASAPADTSSTSKSSSK